VSAAGRKAIAEAARKRWAAAKAADLVRVAQLKDAIVRTFGDNGQRNQRSVTSYGKYYLRWTFFDRYQRRVNSSNRFRLAQHAEPQMALILFPDCSR